MTADQDLMAALRQQRDQMKKEADEYLAACAILRAKVEQLEAENSELKSKVEVLSGVLKGVLKRDERAQKHKMKQQIQK